MPAWQYAVLVCHYESGILGGSHHWTLKEERLEIASLVAFLNERGAEGWDLSASHAQVESDWSEVTYVFKRPRPA